MVRWSSGWFLWPAKKAAKDQNSVCDQLPPERSLWHWAHSSLIPRNSRDVVPARFSGLLSLIWSKRLGCSPPRALRGVGPPACYQGPAGVSVIKLADQAIVGEIILQASLQPLLRLGAEDGRLFGINPGKQPRSPDIGEMRGEGVGFAAGLPAVEQHFDPDESLVRPTVIDEVAGVDEGWNAAGQVEVRAANELGVVGDGSRLGPFGGLADPQPVINSPREGLGIQKPIRVLGMGVTREGS